ncbi:DEKNAAC102322 [Brettanomyces naardenensis]|uniref:DEKNAAC102322 n=1 Tax=Brettanomyces naardenensis TaxID=13370 RepID=A0A448YK96_BRENA|nr:DEKNAAC102322 [Brettanomyces naardenensis]
MASGEAFYGLIPEEDWNTPDYINETKYNESLEDFVERDIIYGGSRSYRNMCHFNSGFFFRQKLLASYDYYFRVEPGVEYYCDFQMDPFRLMRENGKKYGFVISLLEYPETIPTLWNTVEDFLHEYPTSQHPNSAVGFITTKEPIGPDSLVTDSELPYNLCHFWSNFEIGDLNFFRSDRYLDYFNYLSRSGGFYYERWGDAPVHSIAASLLLDRNEIMHFEDIGYTHTPFFTFPDSASMRIGKRCLVPEERKNIDILPHSCLPRWWKYGSGKRFTREYFHENEYI